jgi:hypothetical protein
MQAHEFGLSGLDKTPLIGRIDLLVRPAGYLRDGLFPVHAATHNGQGAQNFLR